LPATKPNPRRRPRRLRPPIADLVRRGYIRKDLSPVESLRDVLAFFKVASPDAWDQVWGSSNLSEVRD